MEKLSQLFLSPGKPGGDNPGSGGDDRKWSFVPYDHPTLGTVHIPLMARFDDDGIMAESSDTDYRIIELRDGDGNIYLAAAGN